ncbi:replication protein A 32 kDa subunit-like [Octopus sinensis]|uniref:Replication protein A 32 kDa subunit-like n=1 Tax=Octopus sinensis TaxID=2607531 RepID=A0A6P7TZ27_9MOLL|nr:replication protein A 32 kDa subunit-like [Octopus sinensis]
MLSNQIDDRFVIGNVELSQITIIGLIKNVKESPSRVDYDLDDHSGYSIQVKLFVDIEVPSNPPKQDNISTLHHEGQYVRVFGNIRSFSSLKSVVAFRIVPVVDINEITMHIAEVIHSHMSLSRPPKEVTSKKMAVKSNESFVHGGLSVLQQQVMEAIRNNKDEQGIHISALQRQLRGVGTSSLRVDLLSEEGYIYSTIDEHHFKTTDC